MEIHIKLPNFKGSINGVTFSNEETLNAVKNVLTTINEKFGEVYNNGFIDCLHDIFEDIENPTKRKNIEQELIDVIEQSDKMTLDRVRFTAPTGTECLTNGLNTCLYTGYGLRPYYDLAAIDTNNNFTAIEKHLNHKNVFRHLVSLVAKQEPWALEDLAEMLAIESTEETDIVERLLEITITGIYDMSLETDNMSLRLYDPTNTDGRLINLYVFGGDDELHIFARQSI
jgi:hypothetical protein